MVNSRDKGKRGERQAVTLFKSWWGKAPWGRKAAGKAGSDLETPSDFPWEVEVKNVESVRVRHFFFPTEELKRYWEQAKTQALATTRKALLVLKCEGSWYTCELSDEIFPYSLVNLTGKIGKDFVVIAPIDSFLYHHDRVTKSGMR